MRNNVDYSLSVTFSSLTPGQVTWFIEIYNLKEDLFFKKFFSCPQNLAK